MPRFLACAAIVAVMGSCDAGPEPQGSRPATHEIAEPTPTPVIAAASYAFELISHDTPPTMQADSSIVVTLGTKNTSNRVWPAQGTIKAGCYWADEQGQRIKAPEGRGMWSQDVSPGGIGEYRVRVRAPATPGTYCLVWDMVEEHVAWFGTKGATPVVVTVTVR